MLGAKPQYLLLAQALISDIQKGTYQKGDLLPSESALCQQFHVSRHTVREAMRLLIDRGLISRHRGIGTVVTAREPVRRYTQSSASITDLPQYAEETKLVPSHTQDVLADEELASLLGCEPGQRWMYLKGFRYMATSDEAIALTHVYVAAAYAGVEPLIGAVNEPIYSIIERQYGERVTEVRQRIDAKMISGQEAKALHVEPHSAALEITRWYYNEQGRLMEVAINVHPASRFSYSLSLRVNN